MSTNSTSDEDEESDLKLTPAILIYKKQYIEQNDNIIFLDKLQVDNGAHKLKKAGQLLPLF